MAFCRVRPLNSKEIKAGGESCFQFFENNQTIKILMKNDKSNNDNNEFYFNQVFRPDSTQKYVYDLAVRPIIDKVLDGYNGTVFAYGQTSSGKTHTMFGPNIND